MVIDNTVQKGPIAGRKQWTLLYRSMKHLVISKFDVCVTVRHWYNSINSQLDTIIIILLILSISSTCFERWFRPSSGTLDCVYSLWYIALAILPTTSCKHSLVLLRMGEIIVRNMLSWLKLSVKLLLLYLVGCLHYWSFRISIDNLRRLDPDDSEETLCYIYSDVSHRKEFLLQSYLA